MVANIVADMVADNDVDMVANMEVDVIADMMATIFLAELFQDQTFWAEASKQKSARLWEFEVELGLMAVYRRTRKTKSRGI